MNQRKKTWNRSVNHKNRKTVNRNITQLVNSNWQRSRLSGRHSPSRAASASGRGFSLFELLVTIVITAIVCIGVLRMLNITQRQTRKVTSHMQALSNIHFSMDKFMSDIILAGQNDYDIDVETAQYDWHDTSHVIIRSRDDSDNAGRRIEWIAAPRYEEMDLVLFRRDSRGTVSKDYIPICENLFAFKVEVLNEDIVSISDPNQGSLLVDVEAQLYKTDPPDPTKTVTVHRSFCLDRFNTPGTLPADAADSSQNRSGNR